MRGQLGPCVYPGNAQAARRQARKPPPIILWSIGILTCSFFACAAALLAIGYLNPFGTVGLSILGVGAVVYFLTIIFLVLSCLWVERKYPGMQPLSFRILTKKPHRPTQTPTTFINPNFSGQVPPGTTPTYRMHSQLSANEGEMGTALSGRKDTAEDQNDKQPEKNTAKPSSSTVQEIFQDEDFKAVDDQDKVPESTTQAEASPQNTDTSAQNALKNESNAMPEKAQTDVEDVPTQSKNLSEYSQKDNNVTSISSAQKEVKVKPKTHHIEIPPEDYSSPSPRVASNTAKSSVETTKDISQPRQKSMETNLSISTSTGEKPTMQQQQNYKHKNTVTTDQKAMENPPNTEKGRSLENGQTPRSTPTNKIKAQESENPQKGPHEKVTDLLHKEVSIPDCGGKPTLLVKQDTSELSKQGKNMDSAELAKPSVVIEKKSQMQKHHLQNPQSSMNLVKDNSKLSSTTDVRSAFQSKNNGSHEHQGNALTNKNMIASSKHPAHNPDLQGALPTLSKYPESSERPKKVEFQERLIRRQDSPERKKKQEPSERPKTMESPEGKLRHDHKRLQSPNSAKKIVSSPSSPKHHRRTADISPRAQRNKDHAVTNLSSNKDDLHQKLNYNSSPSSQSTDVPSSTSSSPPRHHKRMPDVPRKVLKHPVHIPGKTAHSSAQKEEHNRHSQWSLNSDVSASPPSSPGRQRHKSPDMFSRAQRQKDMLSNAKLSSNAAKDELSKRLNQQSSQSSDATLTFTTSPVTARRVVQNNAEQTQINKPTRAQNNKDQQTETSGAKNELKQQMKQQRLHNPQSSSQSKEMGPTAATNSPATNKRFPPNHRENQT